MGILFTIRNKIKYDEIVEEHRDIVMKKKKNFFHKNKKFFNKLNLKLNTIEDYYKLNILKRRMNIKYQKKFICKKLKGPFVRPKSINNKRIKSRFSNFWRRMAVNEYGRDFFGERNWFFLRENRYSHRETYHVGETIKTFFFPLLDHNKSFYFNRDLNEKNPLSLTFRNTVNLFDIFFRNDQEFNLDIFSFRLLFDLISERYKLYALASPLFRYFYLKRFRLAKLYGIGSSGPLKTIVYFKYWFDNYILNRILVNKIKDNDFSFLFFSGRRNIPRFDTIKLEYYIRLFEIKKHFFFKILIIFYILLFLFIFINIFVVIIMLYGFNFQLLLYLFSIIIFFFFLLISIIFFSIFFYKRIVLGNLIFLNRPYKFTLKTFYLHFFFSFIKSIFFRNLFENKIFLSFLSHFYYLKIDFLNNKKTNLFFEIVYLIINYSICLVLSVVFFVFNNNIFFNQLINFLFLKVDNNNILFIISEFIIYFIINIIIFFFLKQILLLLTINNYKKSFFWKIFIIKIIFFNKELSVKKHFNFFKEKFKIDLFLNLKSFNNYKPSLTSKELLSQINLIIQLQRKENESIKMLIREKKKKKLLNDYIN